MSFLSNPAPNQFVWGLSVRIFCQRPMDKILDRFVFHRPIHKFARENIVGGTGVDVLFKVKLERVAVWCAVFQKLRPPVSPVCFKRNDNQCCLYNLSYIFILYMFHRMQNNWLQSFTQPRVKN